MSFFNEDLEYEIEALRAQVAELKEILRWRRFGDERPNPGQHVLLRRIGDPNFPILSTVLAPSGKSWLYVDEYSGTTQDWELWRPNNP